MGVVFLSVGVIMSLRDTDPVRTEEARQTGFFNVLSASGRDPSRMLAIPEAYSFASWCRIYGTGRTFVSGVGIEPTTVTL